MMSQNSLFAAATQAHASPTAAQENNCIARLDALGLIAVTGDDAAHFLHNQLTNDVEHLGLAQVQLAGYCSPKGRLLATFLMWRDADTIMIQLPRELQPAIQKRLQMFVMRAKVKLNDVTDDYVIQGLVGTEVPALLSTLPASPYAADHSGIGTLLRLPDSDGLPRCQWISRRDNADAAALLTQLQTRLKPASTSIWNRTAIHAGIPQITAATQEKFVPQMINYELIGGVNFKKGCYPGQEIVARSQYLGKLKRRMLLAQVDGTDAAAGMEVFSSADPEQPCGMIVNAEPNGPDSSSCLVEIKRAAAEAGTVHLGARDGKVLQFLNLPYALTDPE
jgi:folate-binding protein YgfZ